MIAKNSNLLLIKRALMGVLVCATVFPVCAQDNDVKVDRLLISSHELLVKLDANRADQVWDGASSKLHAAAGKQEFQSAIQRDQGAAGAVKSRDWISISRTALKKAGDKESDLEKFVTILFAGSNETGGSVRELLSFAQEQDGSWLFSGYVIQKDPQQK